MYTGEFYGNMRALPPKPSSQTGLQALRWPGVESLGGLGILNEQRVTQSRGVSF